MSAKVNTWGKKKAGRGRGAPVGGRQGVLDVMGVATQQLGRGSGLMHGAAAAAQLDQRGGIEGNIMQAISYLNASPLVSFFNDRGGSVMRLWRETGQPSGDVIRQQYEESWCADANAAHRKLAHVIAGFTQAHVDVSNGKAVSAHAAMLQTLKDMNQYLGDCNSSNCASPAWMVPVLGPLCNASRRVALLCEQQEGKKGKSMDQVTSLLQTCINRLVTDRTTNLKESKKQGLLVVCNNLCKAGFYTNNMGVLIPILQLLYKEVDRVKAASGMSLLDESTTAQRTTHFFYAGRAAMLDQRFNDAEQHLSQAFSLCHVHHRKNQVRILIFLITVKLVGGKFPSDRLLQTYGLAPIFLPLVTAIKLGRVADFDRCMEKNAAFFAKLGIYVLLHRARINCYLTILRRVHHARKLICPGEDDDSKNYCTRIKIPALVQAFVIMNGGDENTVPQDEIECALVNLMAHQQVMGYISREHQTVVLNKKASPFPKYAPLQRPA